LKKSLKNLNNLIFFGHPKYFFGPNFRYFFKFLEILGNRKILDQIPVIFPVTFGPNSRFFWSPSLFLKYYFRAFKLEASRSHTSTLFLNWLFGMKWLIISGIVIFCSLLPVIILAIWYKNWVCIKRMHPRICSKLCKTGAANFFKEFNNSDYHKK
jgi:hypothetical protein